MRSPRIAIDLDGVLVDFFAKLAEVYNQRHRGNMTLDSFTDYEFEKYLTPDVVTKLVQIFNEPGYFEQLQPIPGAIETALQFPSQGYNVTICTAPAKFRNGIINGLTAAEKYAWVAKWLPVWRNDLIVTIHKELVAVDMLIDDYVSNLLKWCPNNPEGIGFLVNQPWSKKFKDLDLPRNCVRGDLTDVIKFVNEYWCVEKERFIIRASELNSWRQVR